MYGYLIWDFNGTILDDAALNVEITNKFRAGMNMPDISLDFFRENVFFPIHDYYKKIGMFTTYEAFMEAAAEYMAIYQPASLQAPLRAGVKEYITAQKNKGRKQFLLSASQRDYLLEQTNHFGLTGLFDEILGLEDIYCISKLDMAVAWFAKAQINPKDAVVIGDTVHDFEVSEALGYNCILLTGGHNDHKRLAATGALVLDGVEALKKALG
jgi:phosphoglycolate phosphatase